MNGGFVCQVHGGKAPQVKRKAEERIAELRDNWITVDDLGVKRAIEKAQQGDYSMLETLIGEARKHVVDYSKLVELLEGRTTWRGEVTHHEQSDFDRAISELLERMAGSGQAPAPDEAAESSVEV